MRLKCTKCGHGFWYKIRRDYFRCKKCKRDFKPRRLPLKLSRAQWRELLAWFMREQSVDAISTETGLERKRVLRALAYVRRAMAHDVPESFSGTWKSTKRISVGSGKASANAFETGVPSAVAALASSRCSAFCAATVECGRKSFPALMRKRFNH